MDGLNLDALRAARAEANGEAPWLEFGGRRMTLPTELGYDTAVVMAEGDLMGALEEMLSDEDFAHLRAGKPTVVDMTEIAEYLQRAYSKSEGESSASETS